MIKSVATQLRIYENKTKGEKTYYTIMAVDGGREVFVTNVFKTKYNHKFIEHILQTQRKGD